MTNHLKDSIHGFKDTYSELDTPEAKRKILFAEIQRTNRAIATFEKEPNLIAGKLYERNRIFFSDAVKFLNYLEEIKKGDFPEEAKESKEEIFEPLEFKNISQKLLLLESLGVLKALSETTGEEISSRKMGRIIADLLGTKDLTRYLRYFNPHSQPNDKNNPRTENNLTALHRNLVKLKLPILESIVEKQLKEVMKKEK